MLETIKEKIIAAAKERNIKVFFAAVVGSRAYGVESRDSDWDTHFVFVHPRERYLSLHTPQDFIDLGDDITGWELGKFLRMINKSSYSSFELLTSPLVVIDDEVRCDLLNLANRFFNHVALTNAFCGYAHEALKKVRNHDEINVKVKQLLTAARMYLMALYVGNEKKFPPLSFTELLYQTNVSNALDFKKLRAAKVTRSELPIEFIEEMTERIETLCKHLLDLNKEQHGNAVGKFDELDEFFKQSLQ